ncbi:unnamed protein product [Notodromas monacha]|uniref:Uncharacterized protein n=1 Tax=Notodromas monacha TaxID=399045 RepID=A0A7R9BKJ2_9CRUS|nr:unnamed protein product [Notodromas monacha]CAG0916344.1 unnamed protein product [Notodromas monacha]
MILCIPSAYFVILVKLERVLGLMSSSNTAIAQDPNTGSLAYAARCVIVVFLPLKPPPTPSNGATLSKNGQWKYLRSNSRKTITCLAFSKDGMFLASGECGYNPCVRVWDVALRVEHAVFMGHKFGIKLFPLAKNIWYLLEHSMIRLSMSGIGSIKQKSRAIVFQQRGNKKIKDPVPLTEWSAILGEQGNNYFADVCWGVGDAGDSTFAMTKSGLLCEFNNRRLLDRWVELRAAVMTFGSILEGLSNEKLKPMMDEALMPVLMNFMSDTSIQVRDTWLGPWVEYVNTWTSTLNSEVLTALPNAFCVSLSDEPSVAANVCWALKSLSFAAYMAVQTSDKESIEPDAYPLLPFFHILMQKLLWTTKQSNGAQVSDLIHRW